MNFEHMPELKWEYGYYMVVGAMAAICGVLYLRFKRERLAVGQTPLLSRLKRLGDLLFPLGSTDGGSLRWSLINILSEEYCQARLAEPSCATLRERIWCAPIFP
jgi:hypothetical protein